MKLDKWPEAVPKFMSLSFVLAVLVSAGLTALAHWLFSVIFLGGVFFWLLAERFLRCTRCCNYGTPCYCYGGSVAKKTFRQREEEKEKTDDLISFTLGGLLLLFPVLALVFMSGTLPYLWKGVAAVAHLVVMGGWLAAQQGTGCKKCKNSICTLYRE